MKNVIDREKKNSLIYAKSVEHLFEDKFGFIIKITSFCKQSK